MAKSKTSSDLRMRVDKTGFLLDRLGVDCHPLQFLRELTQNSIEAILETPSKKGQIIWDVDWDTYDLDGVYKLSIVDNGVGMTGEEILAYINALSASGSEQALDGNYGVGAKVAAATRNHEGLIYVSWKEGKGSMAHLHRNPSDGEFGLLQFQRRDETWGHWVPIEDEVKDKIIGDHGTKVLLMGNSKNQDTMVAPEGSMSASRWVAKYLNSRYLKIPEGIEIKAREGWTNPRDDKDRNLLRRITGQQAYLEKHCQSSGRVELSDATAYWWILRDEKAMSQNSGFIESSGHMALLLRDELLEQKTAATGRAMLQHFGVILGQKYVVIYIEPYLTMDRRVTTTTSRTDLLIDEQRAPWTRWAEEFRGQIPSDIEELIQRVASGASSKDHSRKIKDRLKQIRGLFKLIRYRPTTSGTKEADPDSTHIGGFPRVGDNASDGHRKSSGERAGRAGGIYSVFMKPGGEPAEEVVPDNHPQVIWVSVKDGTRDYGDLEDRAARFLQGQNQLIINRDFRLFEHMIDHHKQESEKAGKNAPREIVETEIHAWYQQTLMETILGVETLRGEREWDEGDIDGALTEEALTTAVMPRYLLNSAFKRSLGAALGTLQSDSSNTTEGVTSGK